MIRDEPQILVGDVRDVLATLPDGSVQCCVTSPPYWGLRDYGVDGQIGMEPTPDAFVETMVAVFREVRRVLREDGTLWLNLGDSYTSGGRDTYGTFSPESKQASHSAIKSAARPNHPPGLKPKDLCGIPWRVALALQADGWYLRQDIIWHKPNPMPESVTDRCTKAHEYIFLLTKNARYFYDAEEIKEVSINAGREICYDGDQKNLSTADDPKFATRIARNVTVTRNRNARSVWTLSTEPFSEAHFATFPRALPERCIKAGTSEKGCCPQCGAPWRRVVEKTGGTIGKGDWHGKARGETFGGDSLVNDKVGGHAEWADYRVSTTGWQPTCDHAADPIPCTVLDPFAGAGTTLLVAAQMGRRAIGIELNPQYADMARRRIAAGLRPGTFRNEDAQDDAPLFTNTPTAADAAGD